MSKRSTPPRGSGRNGPRTKEGDGPTGHDEPERGRPTVQELAPLDVLMALQRREARGRGEMRTQREMRARPDAPEPTSATTPQEARSAGHPTERVLLSPLSGAVASSLAARATQVTARTGSEGGLPDPESRRPTLRIEGHTLSGTIDPDGERVGGGTPWHPELALATRRLVNTALDPDVVLMEESVAVPALPPPAGAVEAYPQTVQADIDLRLILLREPDSARAAAFRVLRHRIEQSQDALDASVLAVCAPRPRQGATTAAANLALALSECNRARVCLVEGNLRRPALAGLFRFKPPVCLADRLAQDREQPLSPWCVAEISQSLHVLAVREDAPGQPLVNGPAFAAAVEAMRRAGYRHVIIDGPEVLGIADMNLIEEMVDGVLLVARAGESTSAELRQAATQLSNLKLRGLILLDAE